MHNNALYNKAIQYKTRNEMQCSAMAIAVFGQN